MGREIHSRQLFLFCVNYESICVCVCVYLQYVFQPAMLYMERIDVRTEEGVAVFSKHPIIHSDYTLLYR